ncbi:hypothetical protein RQP46_011204 [Phenoliferia psychrophenolica]
MANKPETPSYKGPELTKPSVYAKYRNAVAVCLWETRFDGAADLACVKPTSKSDDKRLVRLAEEYNSSDALCLASPLRFGKKVKGGNPRVFYRALEQYVVGGQTDRKGPVLSHEDAKVMEAYVEDDSDFEKEVEPRPRNPRRRLPRIPDPTPDADIGNSDGGDVVVVLESSDSEIMSQTMRPRYLLPPYHLAPQRWQSLLGLKDFISTSGVQGRQSAPTVVGGVVEVVLPAFCR